MGLRHWRRLDLATTFDENRAAGQSADASTIFEVLVSWIAPNHAMSMLHDVAVWSTMTSSYSAGLGHFVRTGSADRSTVLV